MADQTRENRKSLAEFVPADPEGVTSINVIRDLSEAEAAELGSAVNLINRFVASREFADVLRVEEAVELRLGELANDEAIDVTFTSGIRSLARAMADALERLEAAVGQEGIGVDETTMLKVDEPDLLRAAESARKLSEAIADASEGKFYLDPEDVPVWQGERESETVLGWTKSCRLSAENLHIALCVRGASAVRDAAQLLREIALEGRDGDVAIIEFADPEAGAADSAEDRQSLQMIGVDVNDARLALKLVRDAEFFARARFSDNSTDGPTSDPVGPDGDGGETHEDETDSGDENEDAEFTRNLSELADSLMREAAQLSDPLSNAWSRALDIALEDDEVEAQIAVLRAAMTAVLERVSEVDQNLESAGVDVRLYEWPPSLEYTMSLLDDPSAVNRERLISLAIIDVVETFARATNTVGEKSRTVVSFDPHGQSVERFWDAGGFAVLSKQANLLRRLLEDQREASDRVLGGPDTELAIPRGAALLHLAGRSFAAGDPEAAVFHAMIALREQVGPDIDPVEWLRLLRGRWRSPDIGIRAIEAARSIVDTDAPLQDRTSRAVLICPFVLDVVHRSIYGDTPSTGLSDGERLSLGDPDQEVLRPLESNE